MTEMVYGSMPIRVSEPVLPRWWRTIDRWSLGAVLMLLGIGILLGLAASVPLAEQNNLDPYYYVTRQVVFGLVAVGAIFGLSMLPPAQVRRLGVLGFVLALVALALLPAFGTDLGKGAVRWLNFGFTTFGFPIKGAIAVEPAEVKLDGDLPFAAMMFKGKIEQEFKDALTRLLA